MAISLEELAAVALEGSVGPVTLAVGAGAVAVALAAGATGPLRRMAATSTTAAERTGQFNVRTCLASMKREWLGLVEEARAEYEAGRHPAPVTAESAIIVANADGVVPVAGSEIVVPGVSHAPTEGEVQLAERARDQRGRFSRRTTNGVSPE